MKITLKSREITGRKVKQLRRNKQIPGTIYGPGREPKNVLVGTKELRTAYNHSGFSNLIDAEIEGETGVQKILIKELQSHPFRDEMWSVSFYQVDMKKEITAVIPVRFEGSSPAVKLNIGILVTPIDSLVVKCLPANLPSEIVVDVNKLTEVGMTVHPKDLPLPEGVEYGNDVTDSLVVAYIAPPQKKVEVVAATEEGVEGEEGEETEGEGETEAAE